MCKQVRTTPNASRLARTQSARRAPLTVHEAAAKACRNAMAPEGTYPPPPCERWCPLVRRRPPLPCLSENVRGRWIALRKHPRGRYTGLSECTPAVRQPQERLMAASSGGPCDLSPRHQTGSSRPRARASQAVRPAAIGHRTETRPPSSGLGARWTGPSKALDAAPTDAARWSSPDVRSAPEDLHVLSQMRIGPRPGRGSPLSRMRPDVRAW